MSEEQKLATMHTIVFRSGRVARISATEIQTLPDDPQSFVVRHGVLVATLVNVEVAAIFHDAVETT